NSRPLRQGSSRARPSTRWVASQRTGRVPAITMIANTNIGSVKLRDSTYAVACAGPTSAIITTMKSMAQAPNTTSTSASRCQMPECAGWRSASRWKYFVLKVWATASANSTVAPSSIGDAFTVRQLPWACPHPSHRGRHVPRPATKVATRAALPRRRGQFPGVEPAVAVGILLAETFREAREVDRTRQRRTLAAGLFMRRQDAIAVAVHAVEGVAHPGLVLAERDAT